MSRLLIVLCGLALSGCISPERQAEMKAAADARNDATCRGYGARPGSDAYVNCRLTIDQANEAQSRRASAESGRQLQAIGQQMMTGQPSVRCTSNTFGTQTTTNCY